MVFGSLVFSANVGQPSGGFFESVEVIFFLLIAPEIVFFMKSFDILGAFSLCELEIDDTG